MSPIKTYYIFSGYLLWSIGLLIGNTSYSQNISIAINKNWQFHEVNKAVWYPATVPGEVHSDLLRNKLIPDPYYRDNEKKLVWIEKKDWEYKTTFEVNQKILDKKNNVLVFDGLDTYAKVYLNDKQILETDNMFREWTVDVKQNLKAGKNELRVVFKSAQNVVDSLAKKDFPYVIPDNPRAYARKAQYHFGWDWGPKFTTCGIWKSVRLEAFDEKNQKRNM